MFFRGIFFHLFFRLFFSDLADVLQHWFEQIAFPSNHWGLANIYDNQFVVATDIVIEDALRITIRTIGSSFWVGDGDFAAFNFGRIAKIVANEATSDWAALSVEEARAGVAYALQLQQG